MRPETRFWLLAGGVALAIAGTAALLQPAGWLGLETRAERIHVWLLTVFTAGVFAVLFGTSALLGVFRPLGIRDVHDAGSVRAAVKARNEQIRQDRSSGYANNFGWWTVATGAILIVIYFIGWLALA
jgi:hypothetical protein